MNKARAVNYGSAAPRLEPETKAGMAFVIKIVNDSGLDWNDVAKVVVRIEKQARKIEREAAYLIEDEAERMDG